MKELMQDAIKYLKAMGVDYADIRMVALQEEAIFVKNAKVENISFSNSTGYGIRALHNGSWGFASTAKNTKQAVIAACELAVKMAEASSAVSHKKISLFPIEPVKAAFSTKYEVDPFTVSLDKKLDYLFWACHVMMEKDAIKFAIASLDFYKTGKVFMSTEGAHIEQSFIESGGYVEAIAILGNELQKRSFPTSSHSTIAQRGYEYIKELDLIGGAKKVRDEAIMLLRAKECPFKETTVILDGSQLALQIHESCGHPAELDRVLGDELSFAGGSFLTLEKLGKFKYGSSIVNITADATVEGGAGSFGYDDEGVPANKVKLIENGTFVGYLSSRETAKIVGETSSGSMRADSWNVPPLIRMTNINLEPQDSTLDELINDTKEGLYISTNKSWSIDDQRLNFQFGAEIAWEIKGGKLGRVLKNPIYAGITPQFWNSCSGICNKDYWKVWGIPNCGKGEPVQLMHVGHGASPARFEHVLVGRSG